MQPGNLWRVAAMVIAFIPLLACSAQGDPVVGGVPQTVPDTRRSDLAGYKVETWVEGLEIPWSLVFISAEEALVSERPGRIRLIRQGRVLPEPYAEPEGLHTGEGGLMGLALHPEFPDPPYIYAMQTYREGGRSANRVVRLRHAGERATADRVIIDKIPGHRVHNGGRIGFGPDGMLYITTGDIWQADLAQDPDSLAGKILRLTPDGAVPADNPREGSPIYSSGHRNPQGLAWHPATGGLFSSEHGPSGEYGLRGRDIINVIEKGGNYGWPRTVGKVNRPPYIDPLIMWETATPPGGVAFWNGDLFVATLRSEALIRIQVTPRDGGYQVTAIERWFTEDHADVAFGRLRDTVVGPDNRLYILTSNRDGRGRVRPGDDRIVRISVDGP
ncbi:MAG: PQQ-dependent sugar dehydrogenase [Desulfatitalea sp.]|nr:PQQ-dependent sugar dehydrogenase [Desulfatitalea sp.]